MGDENLPEGQLDMFIDYDKEAEEAERRRREYAEFMKPKTCPACGTEVRNGHALQNGHGIDWPEMGVTLTDQGDLLWKSIALSLAGCSTGFFMGLGTVGLLRERTASTPEDDPQKIGEQE